MRPKMDLAVMPALTMSVARAEEPSSEATLSQSTALPPEYPRLRCFHNDTASARIQNLGRARIVVE
jgi:hypothetical protein